MQKLNRVQKTELPASDKLSPKLLYTERPKIKQKPSGTFVPMSCYLWTVYRLEMLMPSECCPSKSCQTHATLVIKEILEKLSKNIIRKDKN